MFHFPTVSKLNPLSLLKYIVIISQYSSAEQVPENPADPYKSKQIKIVKPGLVCKLAVVGRGVLDQNSVNVSNELIKVEFPQQERKKIN